MLTVASWALAAMLSFGFTAAGYAKVMDQPVMIRARDHLGLSAGAYRMVGVAELIGALGVLIGVFDHYAWIGFIAACGLFALMMGAIGHHYRARDEINELVPAATMSALSLFYLTTVAIS